MKAWVLSAESGVELVDAADPVPSEHEARIRIQSAALNHLDLYMLSGKRSVSGRHVIGSDGAGIIDEIRGSTSLQPGDEVMINPGIPCGHCVRCKADQECERVDILGFNTPGTYAEYVTVPNAQLVKKPKAISFIEAAASSLDFLTAYRMLVTKVELAAGETVAVWGASGGLGTSAIALVRDIGARVIAFAGSDEKANTLKKLGADVVINYRTNDVVEKVRELTDRHGSDVVFECVGAATWARTIEMVRFGGRIVISGTASGDEASQDLSEVYYKQMRIFGSRMGSPEEFGAVVELLDRKRVRPHIDTEYSFSELPTALKRLGDGNFVGKLVLNVEA